MSKEVEEGKMGDIDRKGEEVQGDENTHCAFFYGKYTILMHKGTTLLMVPRYTGTISNWS